MEYNAIRMGNILRGLRGSKTLAEVARSVGVSPSAMQMYEAGERVPRDSIKLAIASYYQTSVASIFFSDEYTQSVPGGEK
jgi:transcriptional regulator with XRE-family HTH domain